MLYLAFAMVLAPTLVATRPAAAANRQSAERAARKACLNGDYTKGVAILSELFLDTNDPAYLFNQGRCLEQNRRYEDALSRFEEYLRVGKKGRVDRAAAAEAESHIASCKASLAEAQAASAPLTPPTVAPPPIPTTGAGPDAATLVSTPQQSQAQSDSARGRPGLRTAGIITASVGVAALAVGVYSNLKVNGLVSDMEKVGGYSPGKKSDRDTYATLTWVGYGVGAAAIATGAILYVVGRSSGSDSPARLAVSPSVGPGRAGALLTGAF